MQFVNLSSDLDICALQLAHLAAITEAHDLGVVPTDDMESAMADRIMAAIEVGEYDLERLKRWALSEIDGTRFPAPSKRPPPTETATRALRAATPV